MLLLRKWLLRTTASFDSFSVLLTFPSNYSLTATGTLEITKFCGITNLVHWGALAVYCRSTSTVLSFAIAVTCGETSQSMVAGRSFLASGRNSLR